LAFDGILMDIVSMVGKIFIIANPVIRESPLPDFAGSANHAAEGVRISALDQLHGMFERDVVSRGEK